MVQTRISVAIVLAAAAIAPTCVVAVPEMFHLFGSHMVVTTDHHIEKLRKESHKEGYTHGSVFYMSESGWG